MVQSLISIIIPVFNRAEYIGMTLDSIIGQSYENWECIVVDDRSNDKTLEILKSYAQNEHRIKVFERPGEMPKGANVCRNYGFKKSIGEYIQWFDSDDIMLEGHLEKKAYTLNNSAAEYIIGKSYYFRKELDNIISRNEQYYRFNEYEINHYNYVCQNINWLTYDFMGQRSLVEKVSFNENLQSFQERNYFSKITMYSTNAIVLDEYLTAIRLHENSIQAGLGKDQDRYYQELRVFFRETWMDLKWEAPKDSLDYLFLRNLKYSMHFKTRLDWIFQIAREMWNDSNYKGLSWFLIFQLTFNIIGRGHIFRKKVLSTYE